MTRRRRRVRPRSPALAPLAAPARTPVPRARVAAARSSRRRPRLASPSRGGASDARLPPLRLLEQPEALRAPPSSFFVPSRRSAPRAPHPLLARASRPCAFNARGSGAQPPPRAPSLSSRPRAAARARRRRDCRRAGVRRRFYATTNSSGTRCGEAIFGPSGLPQQRSSASSETAHACWKPREICSHRAVTSGESGTGCGEDEDDDADGGAAQNTNRTAAVATTSDRARRVGRRCARENEVSTRSSVSARGLVAKCKTAPPPPLVHLYSSSRSVRACGRDGSACLSREASHQSATARGDRASDRRTPQTARDGRTPHPCARGKDGAAARDAPGC